MLLSKAKVGGLIVLSILLSIVVYGVFFTDIKETLFKADRPDLPEIQVSKIKAASMAPPLSKYLFGTLPTDTTTLTETQLSLLLKGTFPSSDKTQGMAVIANGNTEKLLHTGEEILRGVTLVEVFDHYVVLDRSDVREILKFSNENTQLFTLNSTEASITEANAELKENALDSAQIEEYKQQFLENTQQAVSAIGLTLVGNAYQVTQDSVLSKAGFRPKDEIVSINGQPIQAILNNPRMMASIMSIGSVRVGFVRGQERLTRSYKLNAS